MLSALFLFLLFALGAAAPGWAHPADGHHHHPPSEARELGTVSAATAEPEAAWVRDLIRERKAPSFRDLLRVRQAGAPLLVYGRVLSHEVRDGGSLHIGELDIHAVYRGDIEGDRLRLVELRGSLSTPAYLRADKPVFMMIRPAPDYSYLREQLGSETHYVPAHSADSGFEDVSPEAAQAFAAWLELEDAPPSNASRGMALRLLAAGHPRLTRWALDELSLLPAPETLEPAEWRWVEQAMRDGVPGKGELAQQLAAWQLSAALEFLHVGDEDDPLTRARIWAAQTRLGAAPGRDVLLAASAAENPPERAAAAWALGADADADAQAIEQLATLATSDADRNVRRVAIAALTFSDRPEALSALVVAMDSPEQDLRLAAGRGLLNFEAAAVATALADSVRSARHRETREYAAKLLVFHLGTEAAPVVALRHEVSDRELRRILHEGVVNQHMLHTHDH